MAMRRILSVEPGADLAELTRRLQGLGLWAQVAESARGHHTVALEAFSAQVSTAQLLDLPGVSDVFSPVSKHPRVDAMCHQAIEVAGHRLGVGHAPLVMAGPCSVEGEQQIHEVAKIVAASGAHVLRAGAFKPRTSPYSFRGHGRDALQWLQEAATENGLGVVTEVMSEEDVKVVGEATDLVQVGSRNMLNFALWRRIGELGKPVLLKRGMASPVDEWLMAAEHLMAAGATGVIFCERGIQGLATETRNLLDLAAVALLSHVYGLPVVVDPSHGTGRRDLVLPMARAGLAAGAHGILVEVHPRPSEALSDGPQAISPSQLRELTSLP